MAFNAYDPREVAEVGENMVMSFFNRKPGYRCYKLPPYHPHFDLIVEVQNGHKRIIQVKTTTTYVDPYFTLFPESIKRLHNAFRVNEKEILQPTTDTKYRIFLVQLQSKYNGAYGWYLDFQDYEYALSESQKEYSFNTMADSSIIRPISFSPDEKLMAKNFIDRKGNQFEMDI
jgi:hypothetical protein